MAQKLLLADDSVTIQKIAELMLTEEGFEIKVTNNGEEALAVIPSFKPDLVLADIEMPKMNGYQVCEKIKKDPFTRSIPVILLAGAFEPIDQERVKQVMADDFIIKPFESLELTSKINAVLAAQAIGEEAIAVAEVAVPAAEEDLRAMEEILEAAEVEAWPEEVGPAVMAEEAVKPVEKMVPVEAKAVVPEIELPSKDEVTKIFDKTISERISSLLSSIDIKEAVLSSLIPIVKDSVEKTLPGIVEKMLKERLEDALKAVTSNVEKAVLSTISDRTESMLKEMLENSLKSLSGEIEKVIWETVPDLAETIILKEIERIRSEF